MPSSFTVPTLSTMSDGATGGHAPARIPSSQTHPGSLLTPKCLANLVVRLLQQSKALVGVTRCRLE